MISFNHSGQFQKTIAFKYPHLLIGEVWAKRSHFILIAVRVGSDLSQVTASVKQNSQLQEPGVSFLPITGPVSSKPHTAFPRFQPSSCTTSRLFVQAEPYQGSYHEHLQDSRADDAPFLETLSQCKIFALPRGGFTQDA